MKTEPVCGLFAFDPCIDADVFARACREWGVRQAILHPGFFRDGKMARALDAQGLGLWLNLPVFYAPEHLAEHPEHYAITSLGRTAVHDWSHFVCPSCDAYLDGLVREIRSLLARLQPEIISLDFIRHFVFWEKVDFASDPALIEDGCYCANCLAAFEEASGERVLRDAPAAYLRTHLAKEWAEWKCRRIVEVAERLVGEIRAGAPTAMLAIKTVPWAETDLGGAIRRCAGQDVPVLAQFFDLVAPMAFSQIVGRSPEWKRRLLAQVAAQTGKPVLSYVQTDRLIRPEEISIAQFEVELVEALGPDSAGAVLFEYGQLLANPEKAGLLRRHLR